MAEEGKETVQIEEPNKDNKNGLWVLLTILALLAASVLGWMYSKESKAYKNCQLTNAELKTQMASMEDALSGYVDNASSDLRTDLQEMLNTYDLLMEKDASQTDSLQAQKDSIRGLLDELKDTRNRSYAQINKLQKRNDRLREIMNHYLVQIDSLNTLNIDLSNRLEATSSSLEATTSERDKLREQNEQNAELLTKGAQLKAFNFTSEAQRYKAIGAGIKEVTRAKRAEVISSSFSIGANEIAKTGAKSIYMQITNPNGEVLYKRTSDVVTIAGNEILYSGKREIDYQGQLIDMTIVFNLEGKEIPGGNYTVKIFGDGALIGKDIFTLK